jgi:hypothetical protein
MAKIVGINGGNKPQPASEQAVTQGKPQIDLSKSKPIVCQKCGYDVFLDGAKFRKVSKLLTGTPQDIIIPVDVFLCGNCGEVCEELMPEQLRVLQELDKKTQTDGE